MAPVSRAFSFPLLVLLLATLGGCGDRVRQEGFFLERTGFNALSGWNENDKRPALSAIRRSCAANGKKDEWREACAAASAGDGRGFFEKYFTPYRVTGSDALFTGYYEPEIRASRTRHGAYTVPLYGVPSDLVSVDLGLFRETMKGQRIAGRVENGRLLPYATRADIVAKGLAKADIILYTDDPVGAFFLQVQGSGRARFEDGRIMRIAYAGQNGHPYTAIGAVLIREGALKREEVSLQSIRAWLEKNPSRMRDVLDANASYVFFTLTELGDPALGAKGTAGVELTPRGSLAIDTAYHALGTPLWIETSSPDGHSLTLLGVAQDTGGAIKGPARADIYFGVGPEAENLAGRMKGAGTMTVLLPNHLAARLGNRATLPLKAP